MKQVLQGPPPAPQYRSFDHGPRGGRGGRNARGGRKGRGQKTPYCTVCGKNAGHFTKDCKYNKMAKELNEKDKAVRAAK